MNNSELTTYQVIVTQAKANRAIKAKTSEFLRKHEMTKMQWALIGSLYAAGEEGMRVSDLASELDTSLAFVTTTLNILQAKGMVTRSSHALDNRAKVVKLSPEFAVKVDAIEQELAQKLREWLIPSVGREDMRIYIRVIDKISKAS